MANKYQMPNEVKVELWNQVLDYWKELNKNGIAYKDLAPQFGISRQKISEYLHGRYVPNRPRVWKFYMIMIQNEKSTL